MNIVISASGAYIPSRKISNKELASKFNTSFDLEQWILEKTGIIERRKSDLYPSEQGALAAGEALKNSEGEIDFIIVNTFTGDYTLPQTSTLIQEKLGLSNAFSFEINMPCAGPVYALSMADMFVKSGRFQRGLLIGVDKMLDIVDPNDYLMNALFGEGAGAVVVERKDEKKNTGLIDFFLGSGIETSEKEDYSLKVLAGKSRYPIQNYDLETKDHYLIMNGRLVKDFIIEKLNESVDWLLQKHLKDIQDLDFVITHQANKTIIEKCLGKRGISSGKILKTVEYLGNTGSGSIYLTIAQHFDVFQRENKNILICGMGGGLTWGAIFYRT